MKKRIICFGLGRVYQAFLNLYDDLKAEIVALSDNDATKWDLAGVINPLEIKNVDFDYVVITSMHDMEMKQQLREYGIEERKILIFSDVYSNLAIQDNYCILDILKIMCQ